MADKSAPSTPNNAPAQYEAMNGQEAKAAKIVADARSHEGSTAEYKASVSGTETAAKSIVDAARDASNATAQKVAGKGGDFNGMDILDAQNLNDTAPAAGRPMQSANGQAATLNATNLGGTDIAAAHVLNKPVAGQTTTIKVQPGEVLATQFDPNSAQLHMQGKDLVMDFKDGSKIVLGQFAADTDHMPTIMLPNGALVAGGIVIAQLQGTHDDVFNLETAAGGAAGGGNFIYDDNLGSVIGLLSKLPPIPFTELQFPQPQPEVTINDNDLVGGDFTPEFLTPSGDIVISGGFEDWQPNQHTGDLTVTPMNLQLTFTPNDNEVVDKVTISNIPAGVKFYFDGTDAAHEVPVINGTVSFTGAQLASGNIYVLPVGNTDGDIPMSISMLIRDPDNGRTAVISKPAVAVVDAVADLPVVSTSITVDGVTHSNPNSANGHLGSDINLNLNIKFNDNDGSETHTITLKGVPQDWTLTDSDGVAFVKEANGDYTVTVTGNVAPTLTFDPHNWGDNGSATANLTLVTRTEETKLDGELRLDNNVAVIETPFQITIKDDLPQITLVSGPVVLPEHDLTIPGLDTIQGEIKVNFFGDGPGTITLNKNDFSGLINMNLKSNGESLSYSVSADGKTLTAKDSGGHDVFTIKLENPSQNGGEQTVKYTLTLLQPLDHAAGLGNNTLTFPVKFIATDNNGDSVNGQLQATIIDDTPTTAGNNSTTDETSDLGNSLSGNVTINYQADGPGSIAGNGSFTAGGSLAGGVLKSGGHDVLVTQVGNQYIGKVGTETIFTLTIDNNGHYTFTQLKPLDHADGNNANDIINLNFGYKVTDYDGDTATSTITINVKDDAPIAYDDVGHIPDGSNVAVGNVLDNDDLSTDVTNLVSDVSWGGVTKTFAADSHVDAGGKYVEIQGEFGTLKMYEDGEYTYTYDAANHGPNYDQFDLPDYALGFPVLKEGQNIGDVYTTAQQQLLIDTANAMKIDFPTVVNIELQKSTIDVGSYNNSLGAFTLDSHGNITNVDLFFGNATADVTNPLVGTADGKTSYAMNNPDGKVVFFLLQNAFAELKTLGLADAQGRATDPNGSLHMVKQPDGTLKLVFTDSNGDHTLNSKVYTSEKEFNGDGQFHTIAGLAPNTLDTVQFGFEDLTGAGGSGSDRDFNDVMFTATVDSRFTPGGEMKDKFTYTLKDSDGDKDPANLTFDITDNGPGTAPNIVQTIDETTDLNLVVGGTIVVDHATTYALGAPSGAGQIDIAGSLKGGILSSNGVAVTVSFVGGKYIGVAGGKDVFSLEIDSAGHYTFVQKAVIDHADGANPNDVINLTFAYTARDADGDAVQGKILINIKDDAPTAVADVNNIPDGQWIANGNVVTNDILSKDIVNLLKDASFGNVTKSFATDAQTDAGGKFVVLDAAYGQLKVYQDGNYTYIYNSAANSGNHSEQFKYTLIDKDGDTSQAPLTISIVDNGPGTAPAISKVVDETTDLNLSVGGTIIVSGATAFALGAPNGSATFTSTGSKTAGVLSSDGAAISVALVGGKYVGTAGGKEIFTLTLNNTGTYTFVQKAVIDHADGTNPNDAINLNFTYTARDADGDAVSNTISIEVRDDAPLAIADINNIPDGGSVANGNVVTNDVLSKDVANLLQNASFGATTKSFATADGTDAGGKFVLLNATYGTLKIYENGNYTYTLANNNSGNHSEQFKYTLRDDDGDTSNTTLTISIVDNGPGQAPDVARTIDETTDINAVVGQTIVVAGATSFALGTVTGASAFTSTGSKLGGNLTSDGAAISVALVGGKYVGTTTGGKEVFTLSIGNNGAYQFTLKSPIDHADGNAANDIINLNFTYTARDADGDAVEGHIQINVQDDVPVAVADFNSVVDTIAVGNVVTNDVLSKDVVNLLKDVSFGNTVKSFATDGLTDSAGKYVLVNGAEGQLKIYDNGTYTYTLSGGSALPGNGGTKNDVFKYTLKDFDGDSSNTTLTIEANLPKMIVGKNVDDIGGSSTPYEVGTGTGVITGTSVNDLLVGDVGGSSVKAGVKDYNIVLVLDVSGSMNDNNKLALLKQAVNNLMADFNNYQGGEVRVHIVPFATATQSVATFTVTDNAQFNSAVSFVNGLAVGTGNNQYTNYEAPLQSAISWLQGSGPISGAEKFTYFVSDGEPNRYQNASNVATEGTANAVMGEITGADGTNEVSILQGLSEVVGVGIGVTATTLGRLSTIDSGDDSALDVKNAADLSKALQGASPISQLGEVGDDTINAGSGNDLIFGDTMKTDALAVLHGMTTPAGAGWKVFADLEAGGGWTRADTIAYIRTHTEELGGETTLNGVTRAGGNDTINAGDGNDVIFAQEGNDTVNGGKGNDIISGGSGNNVLTGGDGSDTFLFLKSAHGHDTITDFSNAQNDKLDISDLLVGSGYAPGISHVEDYVKIDHTTGQVFVDNTGHGAFNSANHIATINNISSLDTLNVILNDDEGGKIIHTV